MKRTISLALAAIGILSVQAAAQAQNAGDAMTAYDLQTPGVYGEPHVAVWKDQLAKDNERAKKNYDPSIIKGRPAGQLIIGHVFTREFMIGDAKVVASIYNGAGACNQGANSSGSEQTWGTDCPTRIQITQGDNTKTIQAKTCASYDWSVGGKDPFGGDRAYVVYNEAKKALTFTVTSRKKVVKSCTKVVPLPL